MSPVDGPERGGPIPAGTEERGRGGPHRRAFVRAALVAPVAAATPALLPGSAPASAVAGHHWPGGGPRGGFDEASPRFALAVLPDTQYLFDVNGSDPSPVHATFAHLAAQRREDNIAFMTHLGDVTENGQDEEIALADRAFRLLDRARLPYSVLAGNHDVRSSTDDQRGDTPYLQAFGPRRYRRMPSFGGASPDGYNSYHVLRAGGRRWLVLALDWRISDAGITWVQGVLDAHPTLPAIVTTHDLAHADETGTAHLSEHGERLWERVVRGNDQVFLTLNGHYWPPGRTVLTNDAGNAVHVHVANYQDRYYGGGGMVRLYAFDLARGVIDVTTSSPWMTEQSPTERNELEAENLELTSDVDRFSIDIDFDERFAGFAGAVPPAARPAPAVVSRSTVAYWRFDDTGLVTRSRVGSPLAAGSVVRDLTGHGNDLVARVVHGGPEVLVRSGEHHAGQPAHASIRFDGGQSPDRAAVLEAVPGAPVNSAPFLDGYTIEAFVKLPDPFEGEHAFMGLLSWQGRASEAGKTNGYSPEDEAPSSLNVSGERFLQHVVYPHVQDDSPTSWSHALPVGEWMHLAVVNDGRRTVVYVDGSRIARNASAASTGIATVGKPFLIGATPWAEAVGQGFYGWVGDVRISSRPLRPRDFLTPYR